MIPSINQKYRPYAEQIINLYKDRKIEKTKEAEKLLIQLSSRGKGPQSAITKINEKYIKAESAKGKLTRPTEQTYFISGVIHSVDTYKQKMKKAGTIKERKYKIETPYATQIRAKNAEEAKKKYAEQAESGESSRGGEDSNTAKTRAYQGATVNSVSSVSSFSPATTGGQLMRAVSPVE